MTRDEEITAMQHLTDDELAALLQLRKRLAALETEEAESLEAWRVRLRERYAAKRAKILAEAPEAVREMVG